MVKAIFAGMLALTAAACGTALPAPLPLRPLPQTLVKSQANLNGAYLSVDVRPDEQLAQLAYRLRTDLHFLDLRFAIPPRRMDEYHVTVAYFRNLSPRSQEQMAQAFRNHKLDLKVNGWGVAEQKAAYFTVSGIEATREQLKAMRLEPFEADDPHITFGVSEGSRKDVHGVPKRAQKPLEAIFLNGDLHLKQGDHTVW